MKICERCGKQYDPSQEEEDFCIEHPVLYYGNIRKDLCACCACEALDAMEDGVYFETCEKCGAVFDYAIHSGNFESAVDGLSLMDMWRDNILCSDCAIEAVENIPTIGNDDVDDDDGEGMSVYDAALIWASHGKDEDYMYGFSEDELEDAL